MAKHYEAAKSHVKNDEKSITYHFSTMFATSCPLSSPTGLVTTKRLTTYTKSSSVVGGITNRRTRREARSSKQKAASPTLYHMAKTASAAAPRPKIDWLLSTGAALAVFCAGLLVVVADAPLPDVAEPDEPPEGDVLPALLPLLVPEPEPELDAWPGLRFSAALAASSVKACMVFAPDVGLWYVNFDWYYLCPRRCVRTR